MKKLKKQEAKQTILKWDVKGFGLFEATIWDGTLTDCRMCENGSLVGSNGLYSSNVQFLKHVHEALGDLLKELKIK